MSKIKPVYVVNEDPMGFLNTHNPCRDCKYIKNVEDKKWYVMGDTSPDALCGLLDVPVSSHCGTCIGFKKAIRVRVSSLLRRIKWFSRDLYWGILHRIIPKYRYHVAKTNLKPGYYDPQVRITCVIFEETCAFVKYEEDESNFWRTDWSDTPEHQAAWDAFKAAADFWEKNRPEHGYLEMDVDTWEEEEKIEKEVRELAKKVIDNIRYMWY